MERAGFVDTTTPQSRSTRRHDATAHAERQPRPPSRRSKRHQSAPAHAKRQQARATHHPSGGAGDGGYREPRGRRSKLDHGSTKSRKPLASGPNTSGALADVRASSTSQP